MKVNVSDEMEVVLLGQVLMDELALYCSTRTGGQYYPAGRSGFGCNHTIVKKKYCARFHFTIPLNIYTAQKSKSFYKLENKALINFSN